MELVFAAVMLTEIIGIFYSRFAAKYVQFRLKLPAVVSLKEQAEGKLCVLYKKKLLFGKFKIFLQFENLMNGEKTKICEKITLGCAQRREEAFYVQARCSGTVRCRVLSVRAYDWLGLTFHTIKGKEEADLLMLPEAIVDKEDRLAEIQKDVEGQEFLPSKQGFDYSEPSGIREYQPGDSIKSIHWKLTGRFLQLYVKEPSLPSKRSITLFVETGHARAPTPEKCDRLAGELFGICSWLAEFGCSYEVVWYEHEKERLASVKVAGMEDVGVVLCKFTSCRQIETPYSGKSHYEKLMQEKTGHVYYLE